MDVRPGRDEALSRLFEAHYADTVRLAFYLTGSWPVAEDLAVGCVTTTPRSATSGPRW